jgi:hypothetical protein
VIALTIFGWTRSCSISSSNLEIMRGSSGSTGRSYRGCAAPSCLLNGDMCSHLASNTVLAGLCSDKESSEGLVDGIRTAAQKALDIEAGPLLQTLNIVNQFSFRKHFTSDLILEV